jgi:hypothetical protein
MYCSIWLSRRNPIRNKCSPRIIIRDLIILLMFGEERMSWSSSLRKFSKRATISSLFCLNINNITLFSNFSVYVNPLQCCVEFELLAAAVMNATIFWDILPCCQHVSWRFGETYHLHLQGRKSGTKQRATSWIHARLIFDHGDGRDSFLRNVDSHTEGRNDNLLLC